MGTASTVRKPANSTVSLARQGHLVGTGHWRLAGPASIQTERHVKPASASPLICRRAELNCASDRTVRASKPPCVTAENVAGSMLRFETGNRRNFNPSEEPAGWMSSQRNGRNGFSALTSTAIPGAPMAAIARPGVCENRKRPMSKKLSAAAALSVASGKVPAPVRSQNWLDYNPCI